MEEKKVQDEVLEPVDGGDALPYDRKPRQYFNYNQVLQCPQCGQFAAKWVTGNFNPCYFKCAACGYTFEVKT